MARGDTKPRGHFSDDGDEQAQPNGPQRLTHACRAYHCPMPGAILDGGARGICAWHFGATSPAQFTGITQILLDWECVVRAINTARRVSNDPAACSDPKAQDLALREAWADMQPALMGSGWKTRLEPKPGVHLGDWGRQLEGFLAARVKGGTGDDATDTPTVAEMRKRLRGSLASNAADGWDGP